MKPEEMDRAIAEHVGAQFFTEDGGAFWHFVTSDGRCFGRPTEDLNAMHEAEKVTFKGSTLWVEFAFNILTVLEAAEMSVTDGMTCVLQATATQRAEAFLRTIGKWRDE